MHPATDAMLGQRCGSASPWLRQKRERRRQVNVEARMCCEPALDSAGLVRAVVVYD